MPHYNSDGYGSHLYVPWWNWDNKGLNFPRGYHIEVGGGYGMPGIGSFTGIVNRTEGYGLKMKQAIRDEYGTSIGFAGRGEMIPNESSFCEIDPAVVDRWGIPVLRFHWAWSDHELNQVRHMQDTFRTILGVARRADSGRRRPRRSATAGSRARDRAAHLTRRGHHPRSRERSRMGNDRQTSVLNRFCQAHDVKNLFVADGAPFVSNPDKNPTHTIIALAWRTAEYLAEEMRKGNV